MSRITPSSRPSIGSTILTYPNSYPAKVLSLQEDYYLIQWYYTKDQVIEEMTDEYLHFNPNSLNYIPSNAVILSDHVQCQSYSESFQTVPSPTPDYYFSLTTHNISRQNILDTSVLNYICYQGEPTDRKIPTVIDLLPGGVSINKGHLETALGLLSLAKISSSLDETIQPFLGEPLPVLISILIYLIPELIPLNTYQVAIQLIISPSSLSPNLARVLSSSTARKNDDTYDKLFGGLQPSNLQTYYFSNSERLISASRTTIQDWILLLSYRATYRVNNISAPRSLFGGRDDRDIENLQIRCRLIVEELINRKKTRILTMDGHGRTLYYLLYYIYYVYNVPWKVEIVITDLDPATITWHKLFFPNEIIVGDKNIFDYIYSNQRLNYNFLKETVVYLNFCGIGNSAQQLFQLRKDYYNSHLGKLFLSASYRHYCKKTLDDLVSLGSGMDEVASYEEGEFRYKFKTYILT